jgi:hypothetical protein
LRQPRLEFQFPFGLARYENGKPGGRELFIEITYPSKRQASMKTSKPCIYEIRVEGQLTERWSDWFEELAIHHDADGEMVLGGPLTDQAALFGVLSKIHALNLTLISVNRVSPVD